jgi:hypothetical protein
LRGDFESDELPPADACNDDVEDDGEVDVVDAEVDATEVVGIAAAALYMYDFALMSLYYLRSSEEFVR